MRDIKLKEDDKKKLEELMSGKKNDSEKAKYSLLPPDALDALAKLYTLGASKYGENNYLLGMSWNRIFSAMMRHSWAWMRGESYDPEDGQHHLMSVAWCAFSLYVYEQRKLGTDDRTPLVLNDKRSAIV